jgi:solute carrier family 25 (mitochondrial carnitine/acylcarnitine transporter), member 20/29
MTVSDAWVDFLAGWCSGAVAVLAVQPVDTVLTRWQAGLVLPTAATTVNTAAAATTTATAAAATAAPPTTTRTTTTTTVAVWRHMTTSLTRSFGYTALWRGSSPMIGAVPIQNALLMGGYGIGLQYADNNNDTTNTNNGSNEQQHHRYLAIFVGGCTGGVLQSFLMSPVELVKVSQQCMPQQSLRTATLPILTHFFSSSSRVVWTGLGATLLRDGIPHGVWFVSYEMCKRGMHQAWQKGNNHDNADDDVSSSSSSPVVIPLVSGAVAATTAWAVGYPFDLIKTRIQARASSGTKLGIVGTAHELIQQANGRIMAGLYRGFTLKLVRSVPASMIGFTVYEFVKEQVLASL